MANFLTLPRELRDSIYELIFPKRTLHIQTETLDNSPETLLITNCKEKISEETAAKLLLHPQSSNPLNLPCACSLKHKSLCYGCLSCERHSFCLSTNIADSLFSWNEDELPLLYVSKAIREEALEALYKSITFSFAAGYDLKAFIDRIPVHRRRCINKIHVDIPAANPTKPWIRQGEDIASIMNDLIGLATLHVSVGSPFSDEYKVSSVESDYEVRLQQLKEGTLPWWRDTLIHFRCPSLKDVTFYIEDTQSPFGLGSGFRAGNYTDWMEKEKVRFVECLKEKLVS